MPHVTVISFDALSAGQDVVVMPDFPTDSWGQGGRVKAVDSDTVTLVCGTAAHLVTFTRDRIDAGRVLLETPFPASDCVDRDDTCKGTVEEHSSRSGMTSARRCAGHWESHNRRLDRIARDFPDSPFAPSWFDPTYAGESWNED